MDFIETASGGVLGNLVALLVLSFAVYPLLWWALFFVSAGFVSVVLGRGE